MPQPGPLPHRGRVLVVDDNREVLTALRLLLRDEVDEVLTTADPAALPALFAGTPPDVVLLDMNFTRGATSGEEGLRWLRHLRDLDPDAVVLLVTAYGDVDRAVAGMKAGASDYLLKPWSNERVVEAVRTGIALRRRRADAPPRPTPTAEADDHALIGESAALGRVLDTLDRVAPTEANVLLLGAHGTGKELLARRLHRRSARAAGPFVAVDLGALSASLFESELFGHVRGAFTGAEADRAGPFEAAQGGTLFLDEIGNLPAALQTKLLTVLERRAVSRVGSIARRPVDIRLVCATNQPVYDMAAPGGSFRADLLYRINTVEVVLPALRDRPEDIPLLAAHFLRRYAAQYGRPAPTLTPAARDRLLAYPWPGNVRELRHTIERAVILADGPRIGPADLHLSAAPTDEAHLTDLDLASLERAAIRTALSRYGGNISRAAEELGLTRRSLYRRIEKYGL